MIYPIFQQGNDAPPTLYSIMESIVNYNEEDKSKIKNLWQTARTTLFDFNYPLSENVSRETFEHNILNHYLMRSINFETVTLFRIMLENKLNEIMPKYNLMLDSMQGWDVFKAGTTTRTYADVMTGNTINNSNSNNINNSTNNSTNTSSSTLNSENVNNSTSSNSRSDTPQSNIEEVKNGSYVSEFNYDVSDITANNTASNTGTAEQITTGNSTTSNVSKKTDDTTENRTINETVSKTVENELDVLIKFQSEYNNVWSMIYKDLDCLFYGLV